MNWLALRAAVAVAGVYGFFLIFAQFSFVELLRGGGAGAAAEKTALGIMAAAGIAAGFLTAWRGAKVWMVRAALGVAAATAALAPMLDKMPGALWVAALTGASLGVATVALSALIPAWCGVAWVGLGTGLGYACCNLPPVFQQSPAGQAWIGSGLAILGLLAVPSRTEWLEKKIQREFPVWGVVLIFTALVWMDSAAFFIIQHSADLKSATWGEELLWRNAALHLTAAIAAGLWLAGGGARILPATAWVLLAVAALAVNAESSRAIAGWFYPVGVSLYSAALVAWPGWFSGTDGPRATAWRAAWLFAIAGWFGSANGIGMAQTLNHVPPMFVAAAGLVVLGIMVLSERTSRLPALAAGLVVLAALLSPARETQPAASSSERGRHVYISEGCIHCHSQYSRPGSADETIWGPTRGVTETLKGSPVLIGNRRQGPDLTNIGARRSEAWLKLHFIDPRSLSPDSAMPSYAHLFNDGRGDDLVRYLKESGVANTAALMETSARWQPAGSSDKIDAKAVYSRNCAACHGSGGGGFGQLAGSFTRPPTHLGKGPFIWTNGPDDLPLKLARIIKFGIVGTDMPGHESMPDSEVVALAEYVLEMRR